VTTTEIGPSTRHQFHSTVYLWGSKSNDTKTKMCQISKNMVQTNEDIVL